MSEIENNLCVRSVMNVTPVFQIEIELWGKTSILRKVNNEVYIFSCSVRYKEYMCKTKHEHELVYDIHFKHLHQSKCCGSLIDNRVDAPICVMGDKDRETKLNLEHALKTIFFGL